MHSLDRVFDVFSKERRRFALYALDAADGPMEFEELVERVQRLENDGEGTSSDKFEDLAIALKHTHLPKAAKASYLEFDRENNEISISGERPEFQIVLTVSEALERPDSERFIDLDSVSFDQLLGDLTATGHPPDRSADT